MDVDRFVHGDPDLVGPVRSMRIERVRFCCEAGACVEVSSRVEGEVELAPDRRAIGLREFAYERAGGLRWVRATVFDDRGRPVERITRAADGSLRLRSAWLYQDDGGVRYESTRYSPDGQVDRTYTTVHDPRGREVEATSCGATHPGRTLSRYDDEHRQEEQTEYNEDGSVRAIWRLQRDDAGRVLQNLGYDPQGRLIARYWHRYDEDGNEVEAGATQADGTLTHWRYTRDKDGVLRQSVSEEFSPDGSLHHRNTDIQDERGNAVEERHYDAATGSTSCRVYHYDERGNLAEVREEDDEGAVTFRMTRAYDEAGRLTEECCQGGIWRRYRKVWAYDEQGNWVRITHYHAAEGDASGALVPVEEERRVIGYY
jgi:YD repeat-containing protein